jgi:hypothetical protein
VQFVCLNCATKALTDDDRPRMLGLIGLKRYDIEDKWKLRNEIRYVFKLLSFIYCYNQSSRLCKRLVIIIRCSLFKSLIAENFQYRCIHTLQTNYYLHSFFWLLLLKVPHFLVFVQVTVNFVVNFIKTISFVSKTMISPKIICSPNNSKTFACFTALTASTAV